MQFCVSSNEALKPSKKLKRYFGTTNTGEKIKKPKTPPLNQQKKPPPNSITTRYIEHLFRPQLEVWKAESFNTAWHVSTLSVTHQSPACRNTHSLPTNLGIEVTVTSPDSIDFYLSQCLRNFLVQKTCSEEVRVSERINEFRPYNGPLLAASKIITIIISFCSTSKSSNYYVTH